MSGSQNFNGTHCITLVDNGSVGRPHSGQAKIILNNNEFQGTFQVITNFIAITIPAGGGNGEGAGLVYTATVSNGDIGKGLFEAVFGGTETNSGAVAFGVKNSCSLF